MVDFNKMLEETPEKELWDKTIDYLLTLRKDPTINESEYYYILVELAGMVLKTTVKEVEDKVKESSNAPHAQESKE